MIPSLHELIIKLLGGRNHTGQWVYIERKRTCVCYRVCYKTIVIFVHINSRDSQDACSDRDVFRQRSLVWGQREPGGIIVFINYIHNDTGKRFSIICCDIKLVVRVLFKVKSLKSHYHTSFGTDFEFIAIQVFFDAVGYIFETQTYRYSNYVTFWWRKFTERDVIEFLFECQRFNLRRRRDMHVFYWR